MTVAGATALSVETSTNARDAVLARDRGQRARGERVVAHGLDRVVLHQPDVLVGGGVEDDLRPVLGEHLAHALLVLAVGQDGVGEVDVALVASSRSISNRFASQCVEQHERAGVHAGDLAAQLGADRAAGAGHEHAAAGQVAADGLDLHPHRVAAQDVLDLDVAQLTRELAAGLQQLEDGRHRAHGDAARAAGADDRRAQRAGRRRDRDHHLVGLDVVEHLGAGRRSCRARPAMPFFFGIVVDEADGPVAELGVLEQLVQQQPAAVAGADDQHRARVAPGPEAVPRAAGRAGARGSACRSGTRPAAGRRARARRSGPSARRSRCPVRDQLRLHDRDVADQRRHREHDALGDLDVLALRRVPHPVPVHPDPGEADQRPDDGERERPPERSK